MYFRWTPFSFATLALIAITAWMMTARARGGVESNWPLLYYAAVVAYGVAFPGTLITYWILIGSGAALLLRFEFLGGAALTFIRVMEFFFFGYVLWSAQELLRLR